MSISIKRAMAIAGVSFATAASAQVTFYSGEGFHGRQFSTDRTISNMDKTGFNDRASSLVVAGGNWQMCEDARFQGRCVVLHPGQYPSLRDMGLQNVISSVRPVDDRVDDGDHRDSRAYVGQGYDYHRHGDERLFEAAVTSVHAVVGPPERRCWVERREFQDNANVPGAIVGAVVGGIIGHQIGGGHGRDVATAGGAVAGAAIGANAGNGDSGEYGHDVQHCTDTAHYDHPEYWDVTYTFNNEAHRVQMTSPPGPTITVNRDGLPRS